MARVALRLRRVVDERCLFAAVMVISSLALDLPGGNQGAFMRKSYRLLGIAAVLVAQTTTVSAGPPTGQDLCAATADFMCMGTKYESRGYTSYGECYNAEKGLCNGAGPGGSTTCFTNPDGSIVCWRS